jgi:DNA invertase Pin-like site-specific DNA recombinase
MKIGYLVTESPLCAEDELTLKASGCDETVIDLTGERRKKLAPLIGKLRPGDTLVITDFAALASALQPLITHLAEIWDTGANLETLIPQRRMRNGELQWAQMLRDFELQRRKVRRTYSAESGQRHGLTEAQKDRARELIDEGEMTMQEIARAIGCSPPTLYRAQRVQRAAMRAKLIPAKRGRA